MLALVSCQPGLPCGESDLSSLLCHQLQESKRPTVYVSPREAFAASQRSIQATKTATNMNECRAYVKTEHANRGLTLRRLPFPPHSLHLPPLPGGEGSWRNFCYESQLICLPLPFFPTLSPSTPAPPDSLSTDSAILPSIDLCRAEKKIGFVCRAQNLLVWKTGGASENLREREGKEGKERGERKQIDESKES